MFGGALDSARRLDAFTPQEIADAITRLHASGYKRERIRKAVTHLACVFDFVGIEPNPVARQGALAWLNGQDVSVARLVGACAGADVDDRARFAQRSVDQRSP